MKVILFVVFFVLFSSFGFTQESYRKDSLQVKVYSEMFVNEKIKIDSIRVTKVFCDYCSKTQKLHIEKEAIYRTGYEIYNSEYQKKGKHKIALIIRISKEDFSELNNN